MAILKHFLYPCLAKYCDRYKKLNFDLSALVTFFDTLEVDEDSGNDDNKSKDRSPDSKANGEVIDKRAFA